MPSRNVLKIDVPETYYHVYARGASRANIFLDGDDYRVFLNLFKRYLSIEAQKNEVGVPYPHLHEEVELLCFCLMPNHFHLLLYQIDEGAMQRLMRGIMTSYSRYFNKKYSRTGALFESRYKASMVHKHSYLQHISRYIHLNPKLWRGYSYSSLRYYDGISPPEWLQPARILELFPDSNAYTEFVADYEESREMLQKLEHELANDIAT